MASDMDYGELERCRIRLVRETETLRARLATAERERDDARRAYQRARKAKNKANERTRDVWNQYKALWNEMFATPPRQVQLNADGTITDVPEVVQVRVEYANQPPRRSLWSRILAGITGDGHGHR